MVQLFELGSLWFVDELILARMGGAWLSVARPNICKSVVFGCRFARARCPENLFGCSHEDGLHKIKIYK